MRGLPLALLPTLLLAGCATGYIADHIGPKDGIVAPELTRYGLNLRETRCMSERLAATLTPLQLRQLERSARAVERGYFDPDRLTLQDLTHVASQLGDRQVASGLARAAAACGASARAAAERAAAKAAAEAAAAPPPVEFARPASNWLNLGKAGSEQAIAVDASTIEREGADRKAWFRLIDPGAEPDGNSFLLRVDCTARTINAIARRKVDAVGGVEEYREYPDNPLPVEGGTVMEIAYLSLCT